MKILLTGATGYIGKRLLPVLISEGHEVICCVRDPDRIHIPESVRAATSVVILDLLDESTLANIPEDIDGAYYLVHSMSGNKNYRELELRAARNFRNRLKHTRVKHVVYLSGIVNEEELSEHLSSRKQVEDTLKEGGFHFTTLRAGIIIGSGSASFEIIRDLVEKLPVMIAPKWVNTKCQPIGITDVITLLSKTVFNTQTYDQDFDIGGPDILSYKQMLLGFAAVRKLRRSILVVPVMTPRLSSYWLYFVTSTSYMLAIALVDSMKIEVVCRDTRLQDMLELKAISYREALERAFKKIESNAVVSSWKDAYVSSGLNINLSDFLEVPVFGCFRDIRKKRVKDRKACIKAIWMIGGQHGWYYGNWMWKLRGFMDRLVGGVGLRRGRTNESMIESGDALDFWRVLYADEQEGRLLLFAEMKLPGEAWLEFRLERDLLVQTATFRPLGLAGRLYWYAVLPFHGFIFKGMIDKITEGNSID
ncbi:SDR family oxidoreductase [Robertkochia solimangrovi]|uniref:SDR family oxidoreductase n=1 Tax=Robertkochia solimangrovi TaxID=2213046 RepID=UPI001180A508|nr:SDR family oxidoreductase [Robertkochia solimangrovi]TRZ46443.1 DUF2867 domain-containing protein [Robertkochia solimangrovi]